MCQEWEVDFVHFSSRVRIAAYGFSHDPDDEIQCEYIFLKISADGKSWARAEDGKTGEYKGDLHWSVCPASDHWLQRLRDIGNIANAISAASELHQELSGDQFFLPKDLNEEKVIEYYNSLGVVGGLPKKKRCREKKNRQ